MAWCLAAVLMLLCGDQLCALLGFLQLVLVFEVLDQAEQPLLLLLPLKHGALNVCWHFILGLLIQLTKILSRVF